MNELGWLYELLVDELDEGHHSTHGETWVHCDQLTLHRRGACAFCDKYAARAQLLRIELGVPFSGEAGAPDAIFRSDERIKRWSGNVPVKNGERHSHMGATYVVGEAEPPCRLMNPYGLWCSRIAGHEGPCAARLIKPRDPSGE